MRPDEDWDLIRGERWSPIGNAGSGVLRVTLLFGSAAVALALILAPIADDRVRPSFERISHSSGLDQFATGSVGSNSPRNYTLRRSVLQPSPSSVCLIRENGARTGEC